ncbi:MAG TPA: hypothetical protein VJ787_05850, partial [Thermoleophilia bacterium]|nr:hypothetical protein [Thermoleophilia bacterium]
MANASTEASASGFPGAVVNAVPAGWPESHPPPSTRALLFVFADRRLVLGCLFGGRGLVLGCLF